MTYPSVGQAYITIIPTTKGIAGELQRQIVKPSVAAGAAAGSGVSKGMTDGVRKLTPLQKVFGVLKDSVAAVGLASIPMGAQFDRSMGVTKVATNATEGAMDKLRYQAEKLGTTGVGSANDVATAMQKEAMAGMKLNDIMSSTGVIMKFAAATQVDVSEAAAIAVNHIREFGLTAKDLPHSLNIITTLVKTTGSSVEDLAEGFKYVAPVAKQAGMSFDQTAAAMGVLSKAGIKGSMAGTAIRRALLRMQAPTKAAQSVMVKYGIKTKDASGKMRDFNDIMRDFSKAGLSQEELLKVFGVEGMTAVNVFLREGGNAVQEEQERLAHAGDAINKLANVYRTSIPGALKSIKDSWSTFLSALSSGGGLAPLKFALNTVALAIQGVFKAFVEFKNKFPEWSKIISPLLISWAVLIGSFRLGGRVIGMVTPIIGERFAGALKKSMGSIQPFSKRLFWISAPVIIAAGAFALIIKRSKAVRDAFGRLKNALQPLIDAFKTFIGAFVNLFWGIALMDDHLSKLSDRWVGNTKAGEKFAGIINIITDKVQRLTEKFKRWAVEIQTPGTKLNKLATDIIKAFLEIADNTAKFIGYLARSFIEGANALGVFLQKIGVVKKDINPVIGVLETLAGIMLARFVAKVVVNGINTAISEVKDLISVLGKIKTGVVKTIKFATNGRAVAGGVKAFTESLKANTEMMWANTAAVRASTKAMLRNPYFLVTIAVIALALAIYWVIKHWDKVKEATQQALNKVVEVLDGIKQKIIDFIQNLSPVGAILIAAFLPFVGVPLLVIKYWEPIKGFFIALGEGIKQTWNDVANFIGGVVTKVAAFFRPLATIVSLVFQIIWTVAKIAFELIQIAALFVIGGIISAFNILKEAVVTVWDAIKVTVLWFWNNALKPIGAWIGGNFVEIWNKLMATAIWAWNAIKDAALWFWKNVMVPLGGFLAGVFIPLWNTIKAVLLPIWSAISGAATWFWKNVIKPLVGYLQDHAIPIWNGMSDAINWVIDKINGLIGVLKTALDWLNKLLDRLKEYKNLMLHGGGKKGKDKGTNFTEEAAFNEIIRRESGGNPNARNPHSTAYGLGQFTAATARKYGSPNDPANIWRYIHDKYGSARNALAHHNRYGWYGLGDKNPDNEAPLKSFTAQFGDFIDDLRKPRVIHDAPLPKVKTTEEKIINITVNARTDANPNDIARKISWTLRSRLA